MKDIILNNASDFLKFLKSKFPLYHESNVFFRDIHYGVMGYAEEKMKRSPSYLHAERIAAEIAEEFEKRGILKRIDSRTWLLKYPEFALPRPAPAVKPTAQATAGVK